MMACNILHFFSRPQCVTKKDRTPTSNGKNVVHTLLLQKFDDVVGNAHKQFLSVRLLGPVQLSFFPASSCGPGMGTCLPTAWQPKFDRPRLGFHILQHLLTLAIPEVPKELDGSHLVSSSSLSQSVMVNFVIIYKKPLFSPVMLGYRACSSSGQHSGRLQFEARHRDQALLCRAISWRCQLGPAYQTGSMAS